MNQYVIVYAEPFLPIDDSNMILLVRKNKPKWQKGYLNLVGGKVEEGESPQEAAVRELFEETGLKPVGSITQYGFIECGEEIIHCFHTYVDETQPLQPRECETEVVRWYPWWTIKNDKRLIPSLRVVIPLIRSKMSNWIIDAKEFNMDKEEATYELIVPSNLHKILEKNTEVTKILEG